MKVKIVSFGIAHDILGVRDQVVDVDEGTTVGSMREWLVNNYPEMQKLSSLRFAVNTSYQEDTYVLSANDELVIIPPVSGG